jgi:hypothetical protein
MILYDFWCECGTTRAVLRPMGKSPKHLKCRECKQRMFRDFRVNVGVFQPFTETNFNGQPIHVTSAKQRDQLCKEYRVTPDKCSKPKRRKTIAEGLKYEDVAKSLNSTSDADLEAIRRGDDEQRRDSMGGDALTQEIPIIRESV